MFFQIYTWSKFWLTSWKTLGLTAGFQIWSDRLPGGTDLLESSRMTAAVTIWEGFAKKMCYGSMAWKIATQIWLDGQIPATTTDMEFYCWLDSDSGLESANLMLFGVLFLIF